MMLMYLIALRFLAPSQLWVNGARLADGGWGSPDLTLVNANNAFTAVADMVTAGGWINVRQNALHCADMDGVSKSL
jgi:hypothetical protein